MAWKESVVRRRKTLRRASERRLSLLGARIDVVNEIRESEEFNQDADPYRCAVAYLVPEVDCSGPVDPHEPLTRGRLGSIIDRANIRRACRAHHSWCHHNPEAADALGLLVHSWEAR